MSEVWMRRWTRLIPIIILATALAMMMQAVPAGAQVVDTPIFGVEIIDPPTTVQAGGKYDITVRVTRPPGMELPGWGTAGDQKWEVRVYFFVDLNCYSEGKWVMIGGTELYDGWWTWRFTGDSWTTGMADTREFTIRNVKIVDYPRPAKDIEKGMEELPIGGEISLRARFRLRGMTYTANENTFEYYGRTYRVGALSLEMSPGGYWQTDYDATIRGIGVSAAPGPPLPSILIVGALVVLLVVVAVVAVVKKRGGEVPPPPPPVV